MSLPRSSRAMAGSCLMSLVGLAAPSGAAESSAEVTRLLRQPDLNGRQVAFAYGGDLWVADLSGGEARRLTSTPAVESDPHFSPDGQSLAFTSDRSGVPMVYVVPTAGGTP